MLNSFMNLTSSEKIEKVFEKYFQKNILLSIKDEQIKKGKFLLIKNCIIGNNYYFELTIERVKKLDLVRIPYPFDLEEYPEDNLLFLDYRISSLFKNNKKLLNEMNQWCNARTDLKTVNKMFNSILEIKFE
jgi:hypothetical protein